MALIGVLEDFNIITGSLSTLTSLLNISPEAEFFQM